MFDERDEPFPDGAPKDKDAREVINILTRTGKWYRKKAAPKAHPLGYLYCVSGRCRIVVYSTPKRGQAEVLWSAVRRCTHGSAPRIPFRQRKEYR